MAEALETKKFSQNDYIIKQGDFGDTFYIITDGTVKCTRVKDGETQELVQLGKSSYFGERALLDGNPRAANVIAMTSVSCLCLSREDFKSMLGPLKEKIQNKCCPKPEPPEEEKPETKVEVIKPDLTIVEEEVEEFEAESNFSRKS